MNKNSSGIKKLTAGQKELMHYRQLLLNDKLDSINDLLNGRGESFYSFIANDDFEDHTNTDKDSPPEKKLASEKKTDKLISGLMRSLSNYSELTGRVIDRKTKEMYKAFLYCAMFSIQTRPNRRDPAASSVYYSRTFGDIISLAKGLEPSGLRTYDDYLVLDCDSFAARYCSEIFDYQYYKEHQNFFGNIKTSYSFEHITYSCCEWFERFMFYKLSDDKKKDILFQLAKKKNMTGAEADKLVRAVFEYLNDDDSGWLKYQEEQFDEHRSQYTDEEWEELNRTADEELSEAFLKQEEEEERKFEEIGSYGEELIPGELKKWERRKAERGMLDAAGYWRKNIINIDKFEENREKFLKLYFSVDHKALSGDIENMIDTFLFEHRLSAFAYGDDYGMMNFYIEKLRKNIQSEIKRWQRK